MVKIAGKRLLSVLLDEKLWRLSAMKVRTLLLIKVHETACALI